MTDTNEEPTDAGDDAPEPTPELTPEQQAEGERQLHRLAGALAGLDDESLRTGLATMSEPSRLDLATQLNLPRPAMFLGDALAPLFRRKLLVAPPQRQLTAAFALTERVNEQTIAALGDRHDDPSRDDMLDVLPAIIDAHGVPLVTLMLASYAASDAPCQAVFSELLDTDERFPVADPPDVDDLPDSGPNLLTGGKKDDAEQARKREQRKAAKEAKRAAEAARRAAQAKGAAKGKEAQRAAKKSRG